MATTLDSRSTECLRLQINLILASSNGDEEAFEEARDGLLDMAPSDYEAVDLYLSQSPLLDPPTSS